LSREYEVHSYGDLWALTPKEDYLPNRPTTKDQNSQLRECGKPNSMDSICTIAMRCRFKKKEMDGRKSVSVSKVGGRTRQHFESAFSRLAIVCHRFQPVVYSNNLSFSRLQPGFSPNATPLHQTHDVETMHREAWLKPARVGSLAPSTTS
jgi:hypothetical protein